jgi:hypothetical protein
MTTYVVPLVDQVPAEFLRTSLVMLPLVHFGPPNIIDPPSQIPNIPLEFLRTSLRPINYYLNKPMRAWQTGNPPGVRHI